MVADVLSSSSVSTRQRRSNTNITTTTTNNNNNSNSDCTYATTTTTTVTTNQQMMDPTKIRTSGIQSNDATTVTNPNHKNTSSITTGKVMTSLDPILFPKRRDDYHTTTVSNVYHSSRNNNNKDIHHHYSKKKSNQRIIQQRKRRRSYHNKYNDESFLCLFLRVGFVVCFIGYTTYQTYRRIYRVQQQQTTSSSTTTNLRRGDDDNDDDDDDDDAISKMDTKKVVTSSLTNRQPILLDGQQWNHPDAYYHKGKHQYQSPIEELPLTWNLSSYALQFDAYAIAELYEPSSTTTIVRDENQSSDLTLFWQAANGLRTQFADLYGGIPMARAILDRAVTTLGHTNSSPDSSSSRSSSSRNTDHPNHSPRPMTLPDDLRVTACRIWSKIHTAAPTDPVHYGDSTTGSTRTFRFAFGGYSVTVGRGNLFAQSFPFVMEQQLQTVFSLLGIQLVVRNAAIGGCPSFPYGFCTPNFWGESPDVVSWDYSMNEAGGDPIGLEAYMRHIMKQYPNTQPKLIVKDTHMAYQRRNLLQHYYNQSLLLGSSMSRTARDPIVIHTEPAVEPFLKRIPVESDRPIGFQDWRKFGTPLNAPGQTPHHPAVKEHEFIAWVLTMHFLSALEIVALAEGMSDENEAHRFLHQYCPKPHDATNEPTDTSLPVPMYETARNSTKPWISLLFGNTSSSDGQSWRLNDIKCRTSFEPIVSGDLVGIVVSGGIGEEVDVMLPKSKMFYNSGWVLNLGEDEMKAKRNLDRFKGHGFIDSKKGYYGIYASGPLQFFLPYESNHKTMGQPTLGDPAHYWFKSIVTCEVNEKRRTNTCHSIFDVHYVLGGTNATQISSIDTPATTYFGRKICTHIVVPETSKLTNIAEIKASKNFNLKRSNINRRNELRDEQIGLLLTITVSNRRIVRRDEACSISHVIWEQLRNTA